MDVDSYREACDRATLQSDKKGWFEGWAGEVENYWPGISKLLKKLNSDEERLKILINDQKISEVVREALSRVREVYRGKSSGLSSNRRGEAEFEYEKSSQKKPHERSFGFKRRFCMANQAVVRASTQGSESEGEGGLASCLMTRGKILAGVGYHEDAILDYKLALSRGLKGTDKGEAYMRMGDSYAALGQSDKARLARGVGEGLGGIRNEESCWEGVEMVPHHPMSFSTPSTQTSIHGDLRKVMTEASGKGTLSIGPISPGEVVISEDPLAAVLLESRLSTHCPTCFSVIFRAVPCSRCSGVAFCSEACALLAGGGRASEGFGWHTWECSHGEILSGSGMSPLARLSLRLLTQLKKTNKKKSTKIDPKEALGEVWELVGHPNERTGSDLLRRGLMSLFLSTVLYKSGYFQSHSKGGDKVFGDWWDEADIFDEVINVGVCLYWCLQAFQYNAHEIYETVRQEGVSIDKSKTRGLGLAIYPNAAYLNHQCRPTLSRHFEGKRLVLKAVKSIHPGEEVFENYGPVFTVKSLKERQTSLKGRYLFNCSCLPCIEDWPKLESLEGYYRIRCAKESCTGWLKHEEGKNAIQSPCCSSCSNIWGIKEEERLILAKSYEEDVLSVCGNGDDKSPLFLNKTDSEGKIVSAIEALESLIAEPNRGLSIAQEFLKTIWAESGNVQLIPNSNK